MIFIKTSQRGYVISVVTFFVLIITLSIALSMSSLIFYRQRISTNAVLSTQSYYAAEAGIEDALLRLKNDPQASPSYTMTINGVTTNVAVSIATGGSKTITSQGTQQNSNIKRNIKTVYAIDGHNVNFYYGIAVGAGGLQMQNGSRIKGNVFSNGNISGSGTIDNNAIVSRNGNSIEGVYVGGDVMAYSCLSPASVRNLTYVTGGSHTCTVRGSSSEQANEITQQPLSIPQSQIDAWINETSAVECNSADVAKLADQSNKTPVTLGLCKITGDLEFTNKQTLILNGNLYVTGNIVFGNTDIVRLDSSYGSTGGFIISDGSINTGNGNTFMGSGQEGSYLMFFSTSSSDSAIILSNNSAGAVFYASNGTIRLSNNISTAEVAGYEIYMASNSVVEYSTGLENIYFSNGPGGSWKVLSWQEE